MENIVYQKEYLIGENGNLVLKNPKPALEFIENKIKQLYSNIDNIQQINKIKLQIINDFKKIVRYDSKNSIFPEPFGTFTNEQEKKEFTRKKLLIEDFYLYLGNIYSNFHMKILENKKPIPFFNIPVFNINYNEIYIRALDEYFLVLSGGNYPRFIFNYNAGITQRKNTFINIETGKQDSIPNNQIDISIESPIKNQFVYGTTYMLPPLIEKILILNIRVKFFYKCFDVLKEKVEQGLIHLEKEEEPLYNIFIKRGNKLLSKNPMEEIYNLFIKYKVIMDTEENRLILVDEKITMGNLFTLNYIKETLQPEYLYLLQLLFNNDRLNLRNEIMHGNNPFYNYFEIGFASVMIQLLWDIGNGIIFKS